MDEKKKLKGYCFLPGKNPLCCFSLNSSAYEAEKKKKLKQEGGINQKCNRARQNTGSKETLAANGVFCPGRVPACVQRDFRSHHSVWCSVVSEPPSGFRRRNKARGFRLISSEPGLIARQPIATPFALAFGADLDCAEACARSSRGALSEKMSRGRKKKTKTVTQPQPFRTLRELK